MAVRAKGTRLSADHLELCCFRRDVGASRHALPTHLLASFRCRPGVAANGKTARPVTREYDFVRFPGRQNGERLDPPATLIALILCGEIVGFTPFNRRIGNCFSETSAVCTFQRDCGPTTGDIPRSSGQAACVRMLCRSSHARLASHQCICWHIFLISFRAGHTSGLVSQGEWRCGRLVDE